MFNAFMTGLTASEERKKKMTNIPKDMKTKKRKIQNIINYQQNIGS